MGVSKFFLVGIAFPALAACAARAECSLSEADTRLVEAASDEYVNAWLANDSSRVGALLADEVVMIPHHGVMPREGKEAVMGWWFPTPEITAPVTKYETVTNEITGCGNMAMVRGRLNVLEYVWEGKTFRNTDGNWMMIFRKQESGEWKITHRIWNDPPTEEE